MKSTSSALPFAILGILALIWGSSFILMKRGLVVFSPLQVAALRIVIAGIVLAPFAIRAWTNFDKKLLKYVILCGIVGNGIPAILFTTAQRHISSSTSALLNSLTPLSTLLIGVFIFAVQVRRVQVIGVCLGFVGAVALILAAQGETNTGSSGFLSGSLGYIVLPIIATVCYGINGNIVSRYLKGVPATSVNSIALSATTLLFIPYLIGSGFFTEALPQAYSHQMFWISFGSVVLLSVLGSAVSNAMFTHLIQISGPVFSSSVTYLIPMVAIIWGLLDGEHLSALHGVGIAIILIGIYLVNKR